MEREKSTNDDAVMLGIDTGGTYSDAVLWSRAGGVLAKAKALTTRHDLAIGIAGAVDNVLAASNINAQKIALVSMSTTLATNALVEGQGGRAALVMIGFEHKDIERDGLAQALGNDPVIFCPGGHDVFGNGLALDLSPLERALDEWDANGQSVTGFAIAAMFAVRNPAHELAVRDYIVERTGLPVTCSHALTSKLGGPRRALTTLLNARLIAMITGLIGATQNFLHQRSISAPLMVVRGDGALVSSQFAIDRPIETILSGPAASLVGAREMTNIDNAIVSDIGGTTTDIAILDNGRPRIDREGATVGGWRTMVEAVAMRTYGLGGDSEISLQEGALDPEIILGPRRLVPLSLIAERFGSIVIDELERQNQATLANRLEGRFVMRTGLPDHLASGLSKLEQILLQQIGAEPIALDKVITSTAQNSTLKRLVMRGVVQISGLTPSDCAHVLALQDTWSMQGAILGAQLFARKKNGRGAPFAPDANELARRVLSSLTRRSGEVMIESAMIEDGINGAEFIKHPLMQRALNKDTGFVSLGVVLDRPIVGLGASAKMHYKSLGDILGVEIIVPDDAGVANALGAVAGQVRGQAQAQISLPDDGRYRVVVGEQVKDFSKEDEALAFGEAQVRILAEQNARNAGAQTVQTTVEHAVQAVDVEGRRVFISATIGAVCTGRPALGVVE